MLWGYELLAACDASHKNTQLNTVSNGIRQFYIGILEIEKIPLESKFTELLLRCLYIYI